MFVRFIINDKKESSEKIYQGYLKINKNDKALIMIIDFLPF